MKGALYEVVWPLGKSISVRLAQRSPISDLQGKMVRRFYYASGLNVSDLMPGFYLVTLYDTNGRMIHNEKLFKTR